MALRTAIEAAAEKMATRQAYGKTLVELGAENPNLVVMDADLPDEDVVKNAMADERIARFLEKQEGTLRKTIVVKNKLVNLIIK